MSILRVIKTKKEDIISELTEAKTLCSELISYKNENVKVTIRFTYDVFTYDVGKPLYDVPVATSVELDVFNYLRFLLDYIEEKINLLHPNQEKKHISDVKMFFNNNNGLPNDLRDIVYGKLNTTKKEMKTRNPNNKIYIGTTNDQINDQIGIYTFTYIVQHRRWNGEYDTLNIDVTYTPDTPYDIIYQRKITNANTELDKYSYKSGWKPVQFNVQYN